MVGAAPQATWWELPHMCLWGMSVTWLSLQVKVHPQPHGAALRAQDAASHKSPGPLDHGGEVPNRERYPVVPLEVVIEAIGRLTLAEAAVTRHLGGVQNPRFSGIDHGCLAPSRLV